MPAEHGVWGLIAGAALVGLPLGGDLAGLPLLVAALLAVLLRARCRQSLVAGAVLAAGALALAAATATWVWADGRAWIGWAAASATMALLQARLPRRSLGSSLAAGAAFALLAGAVATAGGAPQAWAATAAVVLAVHLALLVPLVRAQLRPDPRWGRMALDAHILALCLAVGAWAAGLAPSVIPLIFGLGLARCAWLVDNRTSMSSTPAGIGAREMAWLPVIAGGLALSLRGGLA